MTQRNNAFMQYLIPKRIVTEFAGRIARATAGSHTTRLIRWFVKKYGVNMEEALAPDVASYASFNDFFTRELKPGMRPLADASAHILSPADGAVSQIGRIEEDRIFQAKGRHFTATQLLGGDAKAAKRFEGGNFATIYLSPGE